MERGQPTPAGTVDAGGLRQLESEIHANRPIRNRLVAALVVAQFGIVSAGVERIAQDDCGKYDTECHLAQANLDVPAVTGAEGLEPTTTVLIDPTTSSEAPPPTEAPTTTPPPPPTTAAPPPPAPGLLDGLSLEIAAIAPAQPSEIRPSYDAFLRDHEQILASIPSLDRFHQMFPNSPFFHFAAEQRQRIAELDAAIVPTAEKYHTLSMDTSKLGVFGDNGNMTPRAFIIHWTGDGYENGVDQFISAMNGEGFSVQYFIDKHANNYQFYTRDNKLPAHGLVINHFAQGVEIETGEYNEVHSPLFSYQPQQLENAIYIGVNFLRRNGLPVDRTTFLGHLTADLIFQNKGYDPYTGNFAPGTGPRKFDPPEELMHVLVAKAQTLDAVLGPR